MEPEIIQFSKAIGATEPAETDEIYRLYRSVFKEQNYFRHPGGLMVVKISRSQKPFWGLTKEIVSLLNEHFSYNVILLKSAHQGWAFTKSEVNDHIDRKSWRLDSKGLQYKINMPLPEDRMFISPKHCLKKLGLDA